MPGTASAAALSVVSFEAVERIGETYTVTIQLTHPLELDRADYLNKDATFLIDAGDGSEPRKFVGCITRFSKTRQTRDFSGYEIVVEPLVARLKLTRASRIYQQQTAPQIIEAILRRHGPKGHQFAFKLRRKYAQHRFRMQYELSDLAYIRLLCEQEGLYFYFTPGKFGEMVVFGDDIDHYIYQPELHVPYRETAGLESGQEAVFSLKMHAKTIPESGGRQPFFNALPAYVFVLRRQRRRLQCYLIQYRAGPRNHVLPVAVRCRDRSGPKDWPKDGTRAALPSCASINSQRELISRRGWRRLHRRHPPWLAGT